MEVVFKNVVERILSNWTALKLAVDHNMGGPNSHQVATEIVNYMTQYCVCNDHIQMEDIQEALEDIMDEEFDTLCEDESPKEIATILYRFLVLLKNNNHAEFESQYNCLPELKHWLNGSYPSQRIQQNVEDSSTDEDVPAVVQDAEWTEVKSRRKR